MKLLQKKINPFSVISIFGVALARPAFCVLTVHDNCTIIYFNFFFLITAAKLFRKLTAEASVSYTYLHSSQCFPGTEAGLV